MNSASWSFFIRNVVTASLMVLLFTMVTLSSQTFSTQPTTETLVSAKSALKSSGALRKLPKRPGYRQSA